MHVGAVKVPIKGPSKVGLVMYGAGQQIPEPDPCLFREVDGEELDDQVVILDSRHAARKAVVSSHMPRFVEPMYIEMLAGARTFGGTTPF